MLDRREKLSIRLPGDPGPNPYDSSTPIKDLPLRGLKLVPQIVGKPITYWIILGGMAMAAAWHRYGDAISAFMQRTDFHHW